MKTYLSRFWRDRLILILTFSLTEISVISWSFSSFSDSFSSAMLNLARRCCFCVDSLQIHKNDNGHTLKLPKVDVVLEQNTWVVYVQLHYKHVHLVLIYKNYITMICLMKNRNNSVGVSRVSWYCAFGLFTTTFTI